MNRKNATTAERLQQIMADKNLRQTDIIRLCRPYCQKYGVKIEKNDLSQYVSGKVQPKQDKLSILGKALNVSETWLMGYDQLSFDNIFPITTQRIPLIGEIACGEPIFATEGRESYVAAGIGVKADFALRCKGDSMVNARILDGDIVFIRNQQSVDNGEIAAVIIGDDATLKRVFYYPEKNLLILKAENPKFEDLIYTNSDLDTIRILGKAVAFQSDVR